ncbi:hypothetical protein B0H14DRAFT_2560388 [Mycena olivaceomarginata]|nr:hypothetical protein B0H14DRAFT_2560388 [Mycena olivaceomarginata]
MLTVEAAAWTDRKAPSKALYCGSPKYLEKLQNQAHTSRKRRAAQGIEIGAFVKIFNQRFPLNKTKTSKLVFVFGGSHGRKPRARIWIKQFQPKTKIPFLQNP